MHRMRPVVTPTEMAAIDAEAPESVDELIERAGWATARAARRLLDGRLYGARIAVLAGRGNNGADGRSAARHLARWGARCHVIDIASADVDGPATGRHRWDLVIDACFGTGLSRPFHREGLPTDLDQAPVLAVDIPSGVDGATGRTSGEPIPADATVTFAAPKPGLLFHPGRALAGAVEVADIGLDCSRARIDLIEPDDVLTHWPARAAADHKRSRSVLVVGGSPGLTGAPALVAAGSLRAGVGHVTVSVPGADRLLSSGPVPVEAIEEPLPPRWADAIGERLSTGPPVGAVVLGPGLATDRGSRADVLDYLATSTTPTVLDAGAIHALAPDGHGTPPEGATRPAHALPKPVDSYGEDGPGPELRSLPGDAVVRHVLTPHDGEFRVLTGRPPGADRIADVRRASAALGQVVLLKGPTTVVADPAGRVLLSTAGDQRLATAGSGDVLAGVIAAALAAGLDPLLAAGLGAELHGMSSMTGRPVGLIAGDLPSLVADVLSHR